MSLKEKQVSECLNCQTPLHNSNYCPQCGQRNVRKSLNLVAILGDAWSVITDLDNRWYRAFSELFTRPGLMVSDYISGKRVHYAGPL